MNTSCSSCAIAVDQIGLQQVFWFSETWSVTVDTVSIIVTTFNGSNATAVTSTKTVLGDLDAISAGPIGSSYISALFESKLMNPQEYYGHNASLVRNGDGTVGTTSFAYGQPYAEARAINYRYLTPTDQCPLNMAAGPGSPLDGASACSCLMNSWFPEGYEDGLVSGLKYQTYSLDKTYYVPLPSTQINETNAEGVGGSDGIMSWDGEAFRSWLAEDEAFKSAFPNWEDCAFWNTGMSNHSSE